ncbi:MAG: YibE/F family protein, partial [Patescibacteria group bacterium]
MRKIIFIILLFIPLFVFAQEEIKTDTYFKAEVIKIIEERANVLDNGTEVIQQDLLLKGLEGEQKGKEIEFNGITSYDLIGKNIYKLGDKVLVVESFDADGNPAYYITDYVRTNAIFLLLIIFILSLLVVGRFKGLRSIISLILSFAVIIKYIIPKILAGGNPILVTVIGSFLILIIIIYITEGFRPLAHISALSIFLSLLITVFL